MTTYDDRPWLRRYPPGVPADLHPPHADMLSLWGATVRRTPDAPAVRFFGTTLTFGALDAAADGLAAALRAGGLAPGDRVGLLLQNDPQWPLALLATWKAGGVAVALNPMFRHRELAYHLRDSGAVVLVCLEEQWREVGRDVVGDTAVRRVLTTHPADWCADRPLPETLAAAGPKKPPEDAEDLTALVAEWTGRRPPAAARDGADVAVLTYTSGTTGPPKGAMNTHGNFAYNAALGARWYDLDAADVVLGIAPLFHITGLVLHLGVSWAAGASLVLLHRFDAGAVLEQIQRWRPTFTIGAITAYIALIEHDRCAATDWSCLTKAASGGAPVSPAVVERIEAATGTYVHNAYGLTETTSPSHLVPLGIRPPVDPRSGALSVGLPVPGSVSRVCALGGDTDLPPGEVGEIVISGPMVVPGYWDKPEESAAAVGGGRLRTGDVGFMDPDGWFYVVDRAKDQINAAGFKVWPRDVEDVLYQHPAVREAAVVGRPDPYRGETVKAFVSLAAGAQTTPAELISFCKERMAAYKYPREVEILEDLPKTPTGKLLRRELRDRASQDR